MTYSRVLRFLIYFGLALSVAALLADPGIGAAAAAIAFIGWLSEHHLRVSIQRLLGQAAIELEIAGRRSDALQQRLDNSLVMRVDHTAGTLEIGDSLGDPPTATRH